MPKKKVKKEKHPKHPKKTGLTMGLSIGLIAVIVFVYITDIMLPFMGIAFLILGALKLYDLKAFADAYAQYDPIASRSKLYAYSYPFIELALGILFSFNIAVVPAAAVTLVIMTTDATGVVRTLFQKKMLYCACVGTFFKLPLTTFTLTEDIGMGIMALLILLGM